MMRRNTLCTTIVVTCDARGCLLCWLYDNPAGATFKAARAAAARAGWTIIRTDAGHRHLCRYCGPKAAGEPVAAAA
jgi:hypothetical protein